MPDNVLLSRRSRRAKPIYMLAIFCVWVVLGVGQSDWCESAGPDQETSTPAADTDTKSAAIVLRRSDGPVLTYQTAVQPSPDPKAPWFERSGFIHPFVTPAGRVVTEGFPGLGNHLHQHGIMYAWTSSHLLDEPIDFWNSGARQGRIAHDRTLEADNKHAVVELVGLAKLSRSASPQPSESSELSEREVFRERWRIELVTHPTMNVFDLMIRQSPKPRYPIKIRQYHYGGLCVRGPDAWSDDVMMLTSEGKKRHDGNHTRPKWVAMSGRVDGNFCGLAVLDHPSNFRHPQPARLHPTMPYFSYAPMVTGPFEVTEQKPFEVRFRFAAFDGQTPTEMLDRLWQDFAE